MCCKLASHADVNRGLSWPDSQTFEVVSRSLRFPHSPDGYKVFHDLLVGQERVKSPQERLHGRLLLGLLASSVLILIV